MAKKRSSKKPLPIVNYHVKTIDDFEYVTELPETKKIVYDHLVSAVEYGIVSGKTKVDLFQIQDSDSILTLDKDKWKTTLTKAIEFYSSIENYEKCLDCQELLSRL